MSFVVNEPFSDFDAFYKRLPNGKCEYGYFAKSMPWIIPVSHKRIVISLAIGTHSHSELTALSRARYAARIGAELYDIRYFSNLIGPLVHWEKLRIKSWLDQGYRVLYLDSDIVVRPSCPNLFDLVPEDSFAAVDESKHPWCGPVGASESWKYAYWLGKILGQEISPECYSIPPWPYYQAGLYIASPCHAHLFAFGKLQAMRERIWDHPHSDQTYLNYQLALNKVKVMTLGREFNCIRPSAGERPHIVHAAGIFNPRERLAFLQHWSQ